MCTTTHRHTRPYTAELTLWIPDGRDLLGTWQQWDRFGALFGTDLIRSCGDMGAVLGAQGRLAARLMEAMTERHPGFRLIAREEHSGRLVGFTEWRLSAETKCYLPAGAPWTACESGAHVT